MKVAKPSDDDKAYFVELFGDHPALDVKPMFGNLAAFAQTNQQMCAGLFGAQVGLRLAPEHRSELLAEPGAGPFGPQDRPMKEYVSIPLEWRGGEPDCVDRWISRALAYTESLPVKKSKAKKQK